MTLRLNLATLQKFVRLWIGLFLYGFGLALMLRAAIGLSPWDVFAQGLSKTFGITYGWASVIVSALVLLAWIPLNSAGGLARFSTAFSLAFLPISGCLWCLKSRVTGFSCWFSWPDS